MSQSERNFNPSVVGFCLLGALALVLLAVMSYSSLRRTAERLSCDFYYPYLRLAAKTGSTVASETLMLKSKFALAHAIEYLQLDNFELSSKVSQLSELERENARLRVLLSLGSRPAYKPVYAEVIARSPASWHERFTIGRGSDNGISEGDLVVAPALAPDGGRMIPAVVGRVRAVSRRTASVCTIASDECKLSVLLSDAGLTGLLEGAGLVDGVPIPTIKYLPLRPVYKVGDLVCTSGVSDATPPSIVVGRLCPWPGGSVTEERDHIYAEARLIPAVNLDAIRFVSVFSRVAK